MVCEVRPSPWLGALLDTWAAWMRSYGARLGYPARSAGLSCGGISGEESFDHMCEDADRSAAVTLDTLIDDLPPISRTAIYQAWGIGARCFRMRDPETVLADAYRVLERRARAKLG